MENHLVKWKGQTHGPYATDALQRMFEDREIGPMHEISVDGKWVTARAYFRRLKAQEPVDMAPPTPPGQPFPDQPVRQGSSLPPPLPSSPVYAAPREASTPVSPELSATTAHAPVNSLSQSPGSEILVLAGFWQRTTAQTLDLLFVIGFPIWLFDVYGPYDLFTFAGLLEVPSPVWGMAGIGALVGMFLYSAILECSPLLGTIGKRALGLAVIDEIGQPLSIGTSSLRAIGKLGSCFMLFAGFFVIAFSTRKAAFHDLLSHSAVVYRVPTTLRYSVD